MIYCEHIFITFLIIKKQNKSKQKNTNTYPFTCYKQI